MMNLKRIIWLLIVISSLYLLVCPANADNVPCDGKTMSGVGTSSSQITAEFSVPGATVVNGRNTVEICLGSSITFSGKNILDTDYYSDPNSCDWKKAYFNWSDTAGGSQLTATTVDQNDYTFTPTSVGKFTVSCRAGDGGHPQSNESDFNPWPSTAPYWNGQAGPQGLGDDNKEATYECDVIVKDITGITDAPGTVPIPSGISVGVGGYVGNNPGADIIWTGDPTAEVEGNGLTANFSWTTGGLKKITATMCNKPVSVNILATNLPDPIGVIPPVPTNGDGGSGAGGDYFAGFGPGISLREMAIYNNVDAGPGANGSNCGLDGYKAHVIQVLDNQGENFCYWDRNGKSNVMQLTGWRPEYGRHHEASLPGGILISEDSDPSYQWDGMIKITDPDGTVSMFRGWYDVPVGPSLITDPAGNQTIFNMNDTTAGLTSVVMPNGDTWDYTCGLGDNRITGVLAPDGDSYMNISYFANGSAAGKINQITSGSILLGLGQTEAFGYNSNGKLDAHTIDGVIHNQYGWDFNIKDIIDTSVQSIPPKNSRHHFPENSYDTWIDLIDQNDPNNTQRTTISFYPGPNNTKTYIASVTDPLGSKTTYNRYTTTPWMSGMVNTVTVDPDGPLNPKQGIQTQYEYYNQNNPLEVLKPVKKIESTLLDDGSETFTDAEFTYYNNTIWPNTVTDSRGNYTQYVRDPNALWKVIETKNTTVINGVTETYTTGTYTYIDNSHGHALPGHIDQISIPDIGDASTPCTAHYDYEDTGSKVRNSPTHVSISHNGSVMNSATVHYDSLERPLTITDDNSRQVECQYDLRGRNFKTIYHKDPADVQIQSIYQNNRRIVDEDEDGRKVYYWYDAANRVRKTHSSIQGDLVNPQDPLASSLTECTYDAFGNVHTSTSYSELNVARTTTYTYDKLNRCTQVDYPRGDNNEILLGSEKSWYDCHGNLQYSRDGNGSVTLFDYDKLNRLSRVYYNYPGDPNSAPDSQYMSSVTPDIYTEYEGYTGLVTQSTNNAGTSQYAYDDQGQLTSYTPPVPANHDPIEYTYNNLGEKTSITSGSYNVHYDYYESGLLKAVTFGNQPIAHYDYDNVGNLTTITYGNGNYTTYTYDNDPRYRLSRMLTLKDDNTTVLLDINCTSRDQSGNPLVLTDGSNTTSLSFDLGGRLSSAAYPEQRVYDNIDQLTRLTGQHRYHYDLAGKLNQVKDDNDTNIQRTYSYHANGLLDTVTYLGGTCTNTWDGGNRIGLNINGSSYTFVYDPISALPSLLEEMVPDGESTKTIYYIRDPNGGLIGRYDGEALHYYHFDMQGSTRLITGEDGEVTDEYAYDDAFGKSIRHVRGFTQQPYQFMAAAGYYTHYQDSNYGETQVGSTSYSPEMQSAGYAGILPKVDFGPRPSIGYDDNRTIFEKGWNWIENQDWSMNASNLFAGWGDSLTLGGTGFIRDQLGVNDVVDERSGWYWAGQGLGTVNDFAIGGTLNLGVKGAKNVYNLVKGAETVEEAAEAAKLLRFNHWKETETFLEETYGGGKQYFSTSYGGRFVDSFNTSTKIAREAKFGAVSMSPAIRQQIWKDAELLATNKYDAVEWHFFKNFTTGGYGPSDSVLQLIKDFGIGIVFH